MDSTASRSAARPRGPAETAPPAAPVRRACTARLRPVAADNPASRHLERTAVDRDLRAGQLDTPALAVGDFHAKRVQHDLLPIRRLECDPADPRSVVEHDAVSALGLE